LKIIESRINYTYGETVKLKPIADVHLGNKLCDVKAFKEYLGNPEESYYIGVGDLLDSIILADLKRYDRKLDASDPNVAIVDYQVNRMAEILMPYKHKIIGLGEGNHEDEIRKRCGTNPVQRLCDILEVPYLGYTWMCQLRLSEGGNRTRTVTIRGHHGWGGGSRTQGGDLTKFARDTGYYDADLFLYGHVHRRQYDEVPRLGLVGSKLIAKPKIMCICGTFQKTLTEVADPSWAETKGFPPVSIGGLTINIKPTSTWVKIDVESK